MEQNEEPFESQLDKNLGRLGPMGRQMSGTFRATAFPKYVKSTSGLKNLTDFRVVRN